MQNEKAKVSPCPMEQDDALIDIRTQVDEAHTDMLRLKSTNHGFLICFWIQGTLIIVIIVYTFFVFYFSGIQNEIIFFNLITIMVVFLIR